MSWMDEYNKALKKKLKEDGKRTTNRTTSGKVSSPWMDDYRSELNRLMSEDVAPTTTVGTLSLKDDDEDQKKQDVSLFDDGWDFGDITKTILGVNEETASLKDLTLNSIKRGYYNSLYGEESYKAMTGAKNNRDVYKKILEGDEYQFTPGNEFAGGVSGAFELIGQMGRQFTNPRTGMMALGAGGAAALAGQAGPQVILPEEVITVPVAAAAGWAAGAAGSTFEIEAGHAYNEMIEAGISESTAKKVALAAGTVNAALESLQVDELLDAYKATRASGATKGFAKRILDELVDRGVDIAKETAQEVAQEGVTIAGVQAASKMDKGEYAYNAGEVGERLWDTAKSSALSFGIMNAPATVKNTTSIAKDAADAKAADKLTAAEQAVKDKIIEKRISEKEKDGTKLTAKEKADIDTEVDRKLRKGYLSAAEVEEAIGGQSYDTFKAANEEFFGSEDYQNYRKLEKENNKRIAQMKKQLEALDGEPNTVGNAKRYDALQNRINLLETRTKAAKDKLTPGANRVIGLRNQMRSEMMQNVQGTRLAEVYRELGRSKQKFEVDVNRYTNENARKTVESILASGLGDNTNQFHDTVDFLAKLSEDKGVTFNFTNNERLKGTDHYKEGYWTHGFVSDDGDIVLNYDSPRALNTTVGHEITHVMEKAGVYKELASAVRDYAIAKEGLDKYNARIAEAEAIYGGKKNTTAEGEVTADLIGEYIFTDYDFVHNLSTQKRHVFQKIYDEIKYMVKIATAGSNEARELLKVKKLFDKAWRDAKAKPNQKTDVKADAKNTETQTNEAETEVSIDPENDADLDYESPVKHSISVKDQETIDFLENQEHITTYKAMILVDGKLYPPMASKVKGEDGKYHMTNPRELGEWMQAEEDTTNIKFNDKGVGYYDLKKDDGGTVRAAYNPYEHSSNLVLNDQFEAAYKRGNLVTVECVIPKSEMDTPYKAEYAKDSTGVMDWHSGVVAGKLKDNKRSVYLSRYLKAVRIVPDAEVAQKYKEIVGDLAVPFNVVSPSLLTELENVGVNIDYDGSPQYQYLQRKAAEKANAKYSYSSIANSFFGNESMSTEEFLGEDYHETEGYKNYVEQCLNNIKQVSPDVDEDLARASIQNSVDGIVRVAVAAKQAGYDIADTDAKRDVRDSKKRLLFSSLEPNSDYFTSHDISTICDKRKNFAEIYDEIVRLEEKKGVPKGKRFFDNVDNYFAIHDIMAKQGLTTPCRQCYVESMRKNLAPMASAFLDLVQETDPENVFNAQLWQKAKKDATDYVEVNGKRYSPKQSNTSTRDFVLSAFELHPEYNMSVNDLTIEMLTTADGLAQLRLQAPLVYEAFNSFYGQAKPKMPKQATPFRFGELTALLTDDKGKIKKSLVDKINSTGGFRLQSYSDFQIQNYVDVLQVLFEAGTLGLNGHAYTKVPAFLDATSGTNLKRNISIFMYKDGNEWKLDRNDSFPYSLEEIYDIVNNDKTGNTSIIAVSQNADMSAWIMANDNVGYGIPFHKSGLKMDTVRKTIVREGGREIKGYSGTIDHTKQQTEVWAKAGDDHKALTKVKKGINIYSFWDFDNKMNLSKQELIEKNVKAYIDQCEMLGYLPKFRNYVMNNGKVLNDVLKYSKELGFVSEDATIEDISFQYKGYTIPYGYYKFLGDFGMFTPDGKASPQQRLSLDGYDFDKAVDFFSNAESLRRTEILQQFANGPVRREMAESGKTTEELESMVQQRRTAVAEEAIGPTQYSMTKDSDGNDLTAEQAEFFADSKFRDKYGNLLVVYHGTDSEFNVFNKSAGQQGRYGAYGIFFADKETASSYGNVKPYYLNAKNVLEIEGNGHYGTWIPYEHNGKRKQGSTDDIAAFADENGYDGVIIHNVRDNSDNDSTSHVSEVYVVFEQNQMKLVTNKNPTEDVDVRFSLSKTVEETKDLMALHNLKADELLKSFDLGGFPMPSIAVIKADVGHDEYGEISLVFPKDTIDPKVNKANKVYGGDAWTPTYPRIEYKPSEAVAKRVRDRYYELASKFGYDDAKPMYKYQYDMESILNGEGGEEGLLQRLYEDTDLMQLYLQDVGKGKVDPVVTETVTKMSDADIKMSEYVINVLGEDLIAEFKAPAGRMPMSYHNEFVAKHDAEIREALKGYFVESFGVTEEQAANVVDKTSKGQMLKYIRNAYNYTQNNGVTVKTETDYKATEEAIRAAAEDGYRDWIDGLFGGVEEKTGIRNNLEHFTPSGNRRSWDALHWEETLENVVRAMKAQDQTGADAFFSPNKLFATAAREYKSIKAIKADSDRLHMIPKEEYKANKEELVGRFSAIANRLAAKDTYNSFMATEQTMECIVDAVRASKTKSGISKKLREFGVEFTDNDIDEIVSLVNDIANMPTGYFEAKPQRAVSFDEVAVFVIPRNADVKLKQELLNRGYNIAEYDPDVEGDRTKVVNQLDEYKFSLSEAGKERSTAGDWHVYGKDFGDHDDFGDFAPVREDAPVPEQKPAPEAVNASATMYSTTPEEEQPAEDAPTEGDVVSKVQTKIQQKIANTQAELDKNRQLRDDHLNYYDEEIAKKQAEYDSKKDKNSLTAQGILRSIERLKRLKANSDADYSKRIADIEKRVEKLHSEDYQRAEVRRTRQAERMEFWGDLIGDTTSWKDFALGITYKTKTLRRILRKVVRDPLGNPDIELADTIYDELETKYDHNEAKLKVESGKLKEVFKQLDLNRYEDQYAQMLGELRHNPDTELSDDVVSAFLEKHKNRIDEDKVNTAISEARKLYDDLIVRVNAVLRENGIKEIPYRQGYFPHFRNPKQNWLQKLLNWKPIDTEIPTSIAGLTQDFKPVKSWQSFAQRRKGDKTDYSLYQGLDSYIHGALDWIYHVDDIQNRRALENYIREIHSDEGIESRIQAIRNDDSLDADEVYDAINAVLDEAGNPLPGLVRELMNRTNTLANKKSSMDREMEDMFNRKAYSTLTNLNNRINANMVVGSLSSALTNFIPMVQSWHQVSPVYTVRGLRDMVRSAIKDDGMITRSDFLTNRLIEEEKLYKTGWDKASDKGAILMNVIDNITSQTVWRSKYLQNLGEGMSESAAIKDADQFSKNLIAGRSRGNMPSIFDAKNPVTKLFTAFQLEVANQYGFMFEDTPEDSKNKLRLVKGYATAFLGAYMYNALYSSLVGRDAAFDPIAIIQDLVGDLLDDDEEEDELQNFAANVLEEVPFIGGMMGGGRIPLSSAFPYANDSTPFQSMMDDLDKFKDGDMKPLAKEMMKPLYYLVLPFGGGQIKKTNEGIGMFSDDHPIAGSYTDSGKLRFPVEDTFGNRVQAALFGQYANENARDYFDNNRSPMNSEQMLEYMQLDAPIRDYWEYRDGLKGLDTIGEKADYINSLDFPIDKKNLLINNQTDRETPIDLTDYDEYANFEEFDWATKNPEKYDFFNKIGISYKDYKNADDETKDDYNWAYNYPHYYTLSKSITDDLLEYRAYYKDLQAIKSKDEYGNEYDTSVKTRRKQYINNLNINEGAKLVLFKSLYKADDSHNEQIFHYIRDNTNLTFEEKLSILKTLGFGVSDDGTITWD